MATTTKKFEWTATIITNIGRYKKLVPAIGGITLLIVLKYFDIDLPGFTSIVVDWLVGAATVFGIAQVRNDPPKSAVEITTTVETTKPKEGENK